MTERSGHVERIVGRDLDGDTGVGRPLSRRGVQRQRHLESYFLASAPPRWTERLAEIQHGTERELKRLRDAREMIESQGGPHVAQRWRDTVAGWHFDSDLNDLIRQHNEWYPIERKLPLNPRTGDYVRVNGRSYRRRELDAAWALEQIPD